MNAEDAEYEATHKEDKPCSWCGAATSEATDQTVHAWAIFMKKGETLEGSRSAQVTLCIKCGELLFKIMTNATYRNSINTSVAFALAHGVFQS
jgi:hypothetical protein